MGFEDQIKALAAQRNDREAKELSEKNEREERMNRSKTEWNQHFSDHVMPKLDEIARVLRQEGLDAKLNTSRHTDSSQAIASVKLSVSTSVSVRKPSLRAGYLEIHAPFGAENGRYVVKTGVEPGAGKSGDVRLIDLNDNFIEQLVLPLAEAMLA